MIHVNHWLSEENPEELRRIISGLRNKIAWYRGILRGISKGFAEDSQLRIFIENALKEEENEK